MPMPTSPSVGKVLVWALAEWMKEVRMMKDVKKRKLKQCIVFIMKCLFLFFAYPHSCMLFSRTIFSTTDENETICTLLML